MKWIVITSPSFFDGEAILIKQIIDAGVDIVHLRKPDSNIDECRLILDSLHPTYVKKIVLHDHFELCSEFHVKGIHINRRNNTPIQNHVGTLSRSSHSFDEISQTVNDFDYLFLSPIFNSISKQGYKAAFTMADLKHASNTGLINEKIIALGGITLTHIPTVKSLGFGGVAFMGDIWSRINDDSFDSYLAKINSEIHE